MMTIDEVRDEIANAQEAHWERTGRWCEAHQHMLDAIDETVEQLKQANDWIGTARPILDNILYWDTCPDRYKHTINTLLHDEESN